MHKEGGFSMIIGWEVVFALGIAFVMTAVFAVWLRRSGPWASYLIYFAIIFLGSWAAGVWLAPIGPTLMGFYYTPALIFGLVFALLLAATAAPRSRRGARERGEQLPRDRYRYIEDRARYGFFFFALMFVFAVAIIAGYFYR
jgi:hypothetical protein